MTQTNNLRVGSYVIHKGEPALINLIADNVKIKTIFSNKVLDLPLDQNFEEAEIDRKCASVLSKKKDKIEILDNSNFETYQAEIDPELLDLLDEGDRVTYLKFKDRIKIIEIDSKNQDFI